MWGSICPTLKGVFVYLFGPTIPWDTEKIVSVGEVIVMSYKGYDKKVFDIYVDTF